MMAAASGHRQFWGRILCHRGHSVAFLGSSFVRHVSFLWLCKQVAVMGPSKPIGSHVNMVWISPSAGQADMHM